uniref:Uncharacterized protein n=1 Tax=Rhizophora mucronata TaxID=61149 RepID=A0A2P2J7V4_RHIMU
MCLAYDIIFDEISTLILCGKCVASFCEFEPLDISLSLVL